MQSESEITIKINEKVGHTLYWLNQGLFLASICFLRSEKKDKIKGVLRLTNRPLKDTIIEKLKIEDEEDKKYLHEMINLRDEIVHTYPVGDEYWYFEKAGKQYRILLKKDFDKKVEDALTKAVVLFGWACKLHGKDKKSISTFYNLLKIDKK